jgi:HSP20 family protein
MKELVPKGGGGWDPFSELERIQSELRGLFDASFRGPAKSGEAREAAWMPRVDVEEKSDSIVVKADLPGMEKNRIDVSVEEGGLMIRGEKREEREIRRKDLVRSERSYGSFLRRIPLPAAVSAEKASASYRNGVLEVTLPKKPGTKSGGKRIPVE